jgi:hypothetical protein
MGLARKINPEILLFLPRSEVFSGAFFNTTKSHPFLITPCDGVCGNPVDHLAPLHQRDSGIRLR